MRKNPGVVVKTATILSSLLLVGGCVSHHAGLFDPIPEAKPTQSAEEKNPAPSDPAAPDSKKSDPVIFYGTKAPLIPMINVIKTPQ